MKVFISWSGSKSKLVANALRTWLPDVIQKLEPWVSDQDIYAGARWSREIDRELSETRFGIICLTESNLTAPWIHFEAGALAKTVDDSYVCPYLIDFAPGDLPQGPLTQFQSKKADKDGTKELVYTLNKALGENCLSESQLEKAFNLWWPELDKILNDLPVDEQQKTSRSIDSKVDEVLDLVRVIARRQPSTEFCEHNCAYCYSPISHRNETDAKEMIKDKKGDQKF